MVRPRICLLDLTPCSRHFFLGDIESQELLDSLRQIFDRSWVAVELQSRMSLRTVTRTVRLVFGTRERDSQLRSQRGSRVGISDAALISSDDDDEMMLERDVDVRPWSSCCSSSASHSRSRPSLYSKWCPERTYARRSAFQAKRRSTDEEKSIYDSAAPAATCFSAKKFNLWTWNIKTTSIRTVPDALPIKLTRLTAFRHLRSFQKAIKMCHPPQ